MISLIWWLSFIRLLIWYLLAFGLSLVCMLYCCAVSIGLGSDTHEQISKLKDPLMDTLRPKTYSQTTMEVEMCLICQCDFSIDSSE